MAQSELLFKPIVKTVIMHFQMRNKDRACTTSTVSVVRRFLVVSALAAIAGCAAPRIQIGDPAHLPMAPGEGALALSMVWSSPMPEGLRFGALSTFVDFEPIAGGDEVTLGLVTDSPHTVPRHVAKKPTPAQDLTHVFLMKSLKPGTYRLKQISMVEWGRFDYAPNPGNQITIKAGEVTYFGNLDIKYTTTFKGLGVLTVRNLQMDGPTNEFARDTAELKAADKRLESVVFNNAFSAGKGL